MLWPFVRLFKIKIFLKSGNVIVLDKLKKFEVNYQHNKVTSLDWSGTSNAEHLKWIDMSQIEAFTQVKTYIRFSFWR